MKFKIGIAPEIRNSAWRRPNTPPITNADDTDGMCLRSDSNLVAAVVLLFEEKDAICSLFSVSEEATPREKTLQLVIKQVSQRNRKYIIFSFS